MRKYCSFVEHFPGKNSGVSCRFLLQGIFLTQGMNPGLQHHEQILYCLNHHDNLHNNCTKKKSFAPHVAAATCW